MELAYEYFNISTMLLSSCIACSSNPRSSNLSRFNPMSAARCCSLGSRLRDTCDCCNCCDCCDESILLSSSIRTFWVDSIAELSLFVNECVSMYI